MRDAAERRARTERQLAEIEAEALSIAERIKALADPAEKRALVDQAVLAVEQAEAATLEAERQVSEKRAAETAARPPLQEARAELQRIETEARTLARS